MMKLYTMVIESFGVLGTGKFFKTQVQIIKPVVIRSLGHLVFWVIMFYIFFLFLCQAICMVIESFGFLVTGKYSIEEIQVCKK